MSRLAKENLSDTRFADATELSTSPKGAGAGAAYPVVKTAYANGMDIREYLTTIFRTGERRLPLKSE